MRSAWKPATAMLLYGAWSDLEQQTRDPDVILVDSPDAIRRQTIALGKRAYPALGILLGMVVLMAFDLVPPVVATLLAAIAMILLRVLPVEQAHRAINWPTLIIVGGMTPLSLAITRSGAAESISNRIVDLVGGGSPYLLLLGLFVVSAILGQLISNTATALIVLPIAISVSADAGISALAVLMCVNVAFHASFLTPIATPANLMVMEPGGYQLRRLLEARHRPAHPLRHRRHPARPANLEVLDPATTPVPAIARHPVCNSRSTGLVRRL